MKEYLLSFFELFEYPMEARRDFILAYNKICASANAAPRFQILLDAYDKDMEIDYTVAIKEMGELSAKAGVIPFTGELLLFICFSRFLRERYRAQGIDDGIWQNSMLDLKYKAEECQLLYGIWGTFVADWYKGFFNMTRFALGRLQFEMKPFGNTYEKNGVKLTPESLVLKIHIPRAGTPLTRESVHAAYRAAADFFKASLDGAPVVFYCSSWLLFEKHKEILTPTSNIYQFIADFDIVAKGEYEDYTESWRLFDKFYAGDPDEMPADSSLRRAYIAIMKRGDPTGWGKGVFVWENGK